MEFEIKINGEWKCCEAQPEEPLLETLRRLNLYSVRAGCETGNCGVCTVWLDKMPILSCSIPTARAAGREVTTVEGVKEEAEKFLNALAEEGADQCGYCSPGLIMAVLAMKREISSPTDEEILHYLNGNLCRCSGYMSQMRAIKSFLVSCIPDEKEE